MEKIYVIEQGTIIKKEPIEQIVALFYKDGDDLNKVDGQMPHFINKENGVFDKEFLEGLQADIDIGYTVVIKKMNLV
jgi:hypothetical protein